MAGLNLQGGFGAGGAVDALRVLTAEAFRKKQEEDRVAAEQAQLAENARQFNETQPIRFGNLRIGERGAAVTERNAATNEGRLAQDINEFNVRRPQEAAESVAKINLTQAQANEILRKPEAERTEYERQLLRDQNLQQGRINLSNLGHAQDVEMGGLTNRWRLGQIAAEGGQARQTNAAKVDTTSGDMAGVAKMVLSNPAMLKDLPPSGRMAVLKEISASGGELGNQRQQALQQMIQGASQTLQELKADKTGGFAGAVGVKGPSSLFGLLDQPMAGTAARGYAAKVDQLKGQLTLPNMELMHGLGAMSDGDRKMLQSAVTALDRGMPESDFQAELAKIEGVLNRAGQRVGIPSSGGKFNVTDPNGKVHPFDTQEQADAFKKLAGIR